MPYRPPFPIPENIHADLQCFQMCIPNDPIWKQVIAGLLDELSQWYNWQRDDDRSGKECAQVWRNIYKDIDWSIMSCCCPEPEPLYIQITAEGVYQTSTDGTTWTDNPAVDPRTSQPFYPPYLPPGTIEALCTYADSIVTIIKNDMVDILDDAATYAEIIGVIVAIFTALMGALTVTVIGALIVGILGAVIAGIVVLGVPAFKAAMTTEVYDRLRCNLYDNMQADGSFTQANIDAIWARIGTDETGIAMTFLQQVVASASMVGLTNMARAGRGSATAECDCITGCNGANWQIWESCGTILDVGEDYITVQATLADPCGGYAIGITTINDTHCCYHDHTELIVGGASIILYSLCSEDYPVWPAPPGWGHNGQLPCDQLLQGILYCSGSPMTLKIFFSGAPCPP